MRFKGATGIALCAAVAITATAGAAGGDFGGFSTRSKTVNTPTVGQTKVAKADCANGASPVAAGFKSSGSFEEGPLVHRALLRRRGSKVAAAPFVSADGHSITGYAYCARRSPRLVKSVESALVQPGTTKSLKPRCPGGRKAVSGGFSTIYHPEPGNFFGNVVVASQPVGRRSWKVKGLGVFSADRPTRLKAVAYCADVGGLTTESETIAGANSSASAVARCPAGSIAVSGGFRARGEPLLLASPRINRRRGSRAWKAMAPFVSNGDDWAAFVRCAKT